VIKRWTWPAGDSEGSVALLKGQEMGRFKLGSTVINLFAPGKVQLIEELKSLSVTKLGQPLAVSTEAVVVPEPEVLPEEEVAAEIEASPLVDDKKDES
jgi:phosphatidylserine decarboxylase